jgi:hypothetical protein
MMMIINYYNTHLCLKLLNDKLFKQPSKVIPPQRKKILNITVITVEQDLHNFHSEFNKYHKIINSPDHIYELNKKDTTKKDILNNFKIYFETKNFNIKDNIFTEACEVSFYGT